MRLPDEFSKLRPALDALIIQMTEYGRDFVCVLEDFHEVHEDAGIHESVHYLLKHLPPNAHFVVTSRQALGFPIAKMRVEGRSTGGRGACACPSTGGRAAGRHGHAHGNRAGACRARATGGWATGIRLVALLCGDGSRTQVDEALACARVSINDYLFEEVFSVLSAKRRRFLAATSVVGSFCLPLTERITGLSREEAAEQVDYFVRNGLFVERFERKEGEDWYRYHPLLSICSASVSIARTTSTLRLWAQPRARGSKSTATSTRRWRWRPIEAATHGCARSSWTTGSDCT
ncbi:MAG: hypothetical protein ACLR3C_11070 [Eggerthella lenta]